MYTKYGRFLDKVKSGTFDARFAHFEIAFQELEVQFS